VSLGSFRIVKATIEARYAPSLRILDKVGTIADYLLGDEWVSWEFGRKFMLTSSDEAATFVFDVTQAVFESGCAADNMESALHLGIKTLTEFSKASCLKDFHRIGIAVRLLFTDVDGSQALWRWMIEKLYSLGHALGATPYQAEWRNVLRIGQDLQLSTVLNAAESADQGGHLPAPSVRLEVFKAPAASIADLALLRAQLVEGLRGNVESLTAMWEE